MNDAFYAGLIDRLRRHGFNDEQIVKAAQALPLAKRRNRPNQQGGGNQGFNRLSGFRATGNTGSGHEGAALEPKPKTAPAAYDSRPPATFYTPAAPSVQASAPTSSPAGVRRNISDYLRTGMADANRQDRLNIPGLTGAPVAAAQSATATPPAWTVPDEPADHSAWFDAFSNGLLPPGQSALTASR